MTPFNGLLGKMGAPGNGFDTAPNIGGVMAFSL